MSPSRDRLALSCVSLDGPALIFGAGMVGRLSRSGAEGSLALRIENGIFGGVTAKHGFLHGVHGNSACSYSARGASKKGGFRDHPHEAECICQ